MQSGLSDNLHFATFLRVGSRRELLMYNNNNDNNNSNSNNNQRHPTTVFCKTLYLFGDADIS